MNVDVHAHYIPAFLLQEASANPERYALTVEEKGGVRSIRHHAGYAYPVPETFTDPNAMVAAMDRSGVDARVISLCPTLFFDAFPAEVQIPFIQRANDAAAAMANAHPGRIWAMASVPLPNVAESVAELRRCAAMGMTGVEIPCNVNGRPVDHADFRPFFAAAAELNMPVFLHPVYLGLKPGLEEFYLVNSIGNPYESTVTVARLLHSGIFAELPNLRIMLAHGGGFFPYQRGRFQHAWKVRPEPKARISQPPLSYAGGLYFDGLTHDPVALRYLIEAFGADKVLMGSDFPFDMGLDDVVSATKAAELPATTLQRVLGQNAQDLFRLRNAVS